MLPPLHPVLARSPEFLALTIPAQYAFVSLWRPHLVRVIDLLEDQDHLDALQALLAGRISLGRDPRSVVAEMWREMERRGVMELSADGGAIVIPLLTGDRPKRVRPAHGGAALSAEREEENRRTAAAHFIRRRRRAGDPRTDDELRAAHAQRYQRRAGDVTAPTSRPALRVTASDTPSPGADVTSPGVTPRASLSPSLSREMNSLREGETPEIPERAPAGVTAGDVTAPDVTDPPPVTSGAALSDEQLADAALDGLARGGAKFARGNESPGERMGLVALMRSRELTLGDLELAGLELAASDVTKLFPWASTVTRLGMVDLRFLLGRRGAEGYEGERLMTLVIGGRDRERERARRRPVPAPTLPGIVKADPVPVDGRAGAALIRDARKNGFQGVG